MTGKTFTWAAVGRTYHDVTLEAINRPRPTTLCGKAAVVHGTITTAHGEALADEAKCARCTRLDTRASPHAEQGRWG